MKKYALILFLCLFLGISLQAQKIEYYPDSVLKHRIFKMEFFSPITGNLTLGYEQYLKNFTSIEAKLGIIGIGKQETFEATGVFLKIGPKFKLKPNYAVDGTFGTHLLRGSYIRPELAFSYFNYKDEFYYYQRNGEEEVNVTSIAFLINYGQQYVLGTIMTLDWYVGLGYAFTSHGNQGYYFGYTAGDNDTPIAFNLGFTLGFLLR